MWNLISVCLEIVLVSVHERFMICAKCTIALKLFWTHPMEHLGDVGHVESRFGPFGDSVSVIARQVQDLHQMYHRLTNHFGCTRWYS
jgi:hypothetical protein